MPIWLSLYITQTDMQPPNLLFMVLVSLCILHTSGPHTILTLFYMYPYLYKMCSQQNYVR
jgi:hypothetical protein